MLVYNDSMNERSPLSAAISADGDRSYTSKGDIVTGPGSYAYPSAIQTRDGRIHVVFTTEERTVILHAVFAEEAIPPVQPFPQS